MLTGEQNYVIALLRKSMGGSDRVPEEPEDLNIVETIVRRNGILLTVYGELPAALQQSLEERYLAAARQAVLQDYEGTRVLEALGEAGMNAIGLKGWELRKLYPEAGMRQMSDVDILVRPYSFEKIKAVMNALGFSSGRESTWKHDSFSKGEVHVEMHKRLTDDSGAIRDWENSLWDNAVALEDGTMQMSPEDSYLFHFVHLHKDFLNGSLGLRRVVDTWLQQRQPLDWSKVRDRLESFGMLPFHERMVRLSQTLMGERPMDEQAEILLAHACRRGIYGSGKNYKAGRIVAMGKSFAGGKLRSKLAAVFLPYSRMKAQFPALERRPILLPYFWMKRIFRFLRGDMRKNRRMLDYSGLSREDYEEMKRFFQAGGVLSDSRSGDKV